MVLKEGASNCYFSVLQVIPHFVTIFKRGSGIVFIHLHPVCLPAAITSAPIWQCDIGVFHANLLDKSKCGYNLTQMSIP
jgi:hypothetical protein